MYASRKFGSRVTAYKTKQKIKNIPRQNVGLENVTKHYATDLFKMVYGQPYLSLGIEHTAQVAPSHCKVGLSLNGFQVTSLQWV